MTSCHHFLPIKSNEPTLRLFPHLSRRRVLRCGRARPGLAAHTKRIAAAEAGLLAGRRAATHWRYCDQFADRFQDVQLERDRIWVQDGSVWSSAGMSAGVDLTLALIEKDQGVSVALQVARELVVFLKRPGGQSQFSTGLSGQISDAAGPLSSLFAWIADHLDADLRAEVLAERVGMSLQTFARTFVARTGLTPAKAVEMVRIQAAREAIEQSDTPLGVIAARCGFGDEQRDAARLPAAIQLDVRRHSSPIHALTTLHNGGGTGGLARVATQSKCVGRE